MADQAKTMTLSLRLLRAGLGSANALRVDSTLEPVESTFGELFVGQSQAHPPSWLSFVNHYAAAPQKLYSQSCAAVLFLAVTLKKTGTRTFAICFGTGHHALDPDALERNFGLKVVLNSVKRGKLRTLDTAMLDATTMQKRVQASRDSDLRDFGVDANRDLLRLASGSPDNIAFATALAGKDALTLRTSLSPAELQSRCEVALKLHDAEDYKTDFGFIDHVTSVKNSRTTAVLDHRAFDALSALVAGGVSDLHLALPDILSPETAIEIGYFGTGLRSGTKQSYAELAIEEYVAELQAGDFSSIADMTALKASHEIRVMKDGEGDKKQKRKLYSCFVFETEYDGQTYVLFDGEWFLVELGFYKEVQDVYERLIKPAFVTSTTAKNERAFIAELDANPDLLNIDQTKASPKAARGANLEPCDFLSRAKQFIHLKDGHGSAPLSHLWNQGLVASESFLRDETFRKKFRSEAKKRQKKANKSGFELLLPDGRSKPAASEYTIVYGVMRHPYKASGNLGLPFFSKVSLRAAAERLELVGFGVELHLIRKHSMVD